jgi:outer membrane protein assembly factor BamB
VPRRIVADRQYLYATLGHRAGLSVLDPATGETLRTIEGSENTQEIAQVGRTLLLRLAGVGVRRGEPRGFIAAVDADEGDIVWSVRADQFVGQSLAAANGRVVYDNSKEIVCLSLADGGELWREEGAGGRGERTLILHGDLVLEGGSPGVVARSAETGKTVWSARGGGPSMRPQDLFVAQGHAWHAAAGGIAGYDLTTGKATKIVDPSGVQSAGHHLRCHRAKATERFIITQFRGAEFVSLTDDEHCNNDWVRGACRYGVMPCNGLLYIPPNPCFCYPGVKLTGLLALAPAGDAPLRLRSGRRLERGEAYREAGALLAAGQGAADDWPTYRHDARRSGATGSGVPAQVATRWEVRVGGAVTPPVASGGRVYVAAKQEHTLHAYSVDGGRELWHFVAGGRIDSPPTLCGELVLLGCGDGYVYCLRASDGRMVWRFRAAPSTERVVARGRLESPWRVHGSVLLKDGIAYCTAGRSTFLDGGIWVLGLDPRTGRVVHEAHLDTWSRTREDAEGKPFIPSYHIEGAHSDILVSEGPYIYLGQYKLDLALAEQAAPYVMPGPDDRTTTMDISQEGFTVGDPAMDKGYEEIRDFHRYMESAHPELTKEYEEAYGGHNLGDRQSGLRLVATGGFLDDSWFNRTYWMYSSVWPGWYHAHRGAKTGQLLVVGDERTYAVQAFPTRNKQSPLFEPGAKGYLLLADSNDNEPLLDYRTRGATKGLGYTRMRPPEWYEWTPIRIRAMVLAGKHLFVAGPPDVVDADDPMASFEGRKGAKLRVVSADDGGKLAEYDLDIPPVFDGMIAASGRLFMCTTEGRLVCLGGA